MEYKLQIRKPTMLDYVLVETPIMSRRDRFNTDLKRMPISELDPKQARAYVELMYDIFIEHWETTVGRKCCKFCKEAVKNGDNND